MRDHFTRTMTSLWNCTMAYILLEQTFVFIGELFCPDFTRMLFAYWWKRFNLFALCLILTFLWAFYSCVLYTGWRIFNSYESDGISSDWPIAAAAAYIVGIKYIHTQIYIYIYLYKILIGIISILNVHDIWTFVHNSIVFF